MMKTLILAFLLVFSWHIGFSQSRAIDSLKHELAIAKVDTSRALIMADLADYYKFNNPDSSLYYAQQALILSRKVKFPKGEFLGFFRMGFAFGVLENYPRALEMQLKALRLAEKHNFRSQKTYVFSRLGTIYRDAGDYPKSLEYLKKSERLLDSLPGEREDLTAVQTLLARTYFLMNRLDSAQYYAQKSYENINRWKVEWMRSPNLLALGRLAANKGNFSLAFDYFRQSVPHAYSFDDYIYATQSYLEMAKIYQQTNQPDSCVFYAQKSLSDAQKGNLYNNIVVSSLFLSGLYEKEDPALALHYHKIAAAARERLIKFGSLAVIQNQVAFDEEERQYELETAQAAWRNQVWRYALLAGLGMALLIAFIFYHNNRKKQKANAVLQEQKDKVETTLSQLQSTQAQLIQSEKLASLGELTAGIAHEIQNPLNFVNNFAEVSAEMLGEMKEEVKAGNTSEVIAIADDLEQNLSKINHHGQRASSIVKGMLEHSRASTGVKEPTDLNALADEYLRLAYHGLRAKDDNFNATLETHFDPNLPLVSVIPQDIGRVLLNLINNAFYAVAERSRSTVNEKAKQGIESYTPTVTVSTRQLENAIEISVQDNGNGIPEAIQDKIFQPFFTTKPTGQGTGLGLSLAYDIVVKGHGGNLEVKSKGKDGTKFTIQLPVKSKS